MISLHPHHVASQLWFAVKPPQGGEEPEDRKVESDLDARPLRVLIVEDEFFISLDMQNLLRGLGHTVTGIAVSADEALRMVKNEQPDVALVDIRLIGIRDGIDLALELLTRFAVPTLFATANTDPQTRARAQAVEPLGMLEKPVTAQGLTDGLRRVPRL